ncbi:MAG: aminopeptidase P family protein [Spirochaetaceae bacterium]|jgi:Xaa-Pro aminopeptidase|nr:aminopeptidase P family protein [Spirochaetaceae bacterium]
MTIDEKIKLIIDAENTVGMIGLPTAARIDGWLFYNFSHRDRLTDELLRLDREAVSTRRWFCLIPAVGEPVKIVHTIEREILDGIPGRRFVYSGAAELAGFLETFRGSVFAALCDSGLPAVSGLDAGAAALAASAGICLVSAASLMQRLRGVLDSSGIASHERAASVLYRTTEAAWKHISGRYRKGERFSEGEVQRLILASFEENGLVTDHPPIVAFGPNSGNPHYSIPEEGRTRGEGRIVREGDIIQLDMWAKEPGGIYADISWTGVFAAKVPAEAERAFAVIAGARDRVYSVLEEKIPAGVPVTGAELDELVREHIIQAGYGSALRHRTGHGIDTECHGAGVNLDSFEFPDRRYILEGSCFSVEPGVYFDNFGLRTEINIYISGGHPVISGTDRSSSAENSAGGFCIQKKILAVSPDCGKL